MKKMSRKFWMIAVLVLVAALVPTAAFAQTPVSGNPTCGDLGFEFGVKWDNPNAGDTWSVVTQWGTITVVASSVNKDGAQPRSFSWTSTFDVDGVFVKAGPGGWTYDYAGTGDTGGAGLSAPRGRGVSHINICWNTPVVVEEPA